MSKTIQRIGLIGAALLAVVVGCKAAPGHATSPTAGGNAPAAVLEFHILLASGDISNADLQQRRQHLQADGPAVQPGDTMRWYDAARPEDTGGIAGTYNGKTYFLAWTTANKSLDHRPGAPNWWLKKSQSTTDQFGQMVVEFTFDDEGAKLFGDFTQNNLHKAVAIVLGNKIISAPIIESRIAKSGTIDGGPDGFSQQELDYLVNTLNSPPNTDK